MKSSKIYCISQVLSKHNKTDCLSWHLLLDFCYVSETETQWTSAAQMHFSITYKNLTYKLLLREHPLRHRHITEVHSCLRSAGLCDDHYQKCSKFHRFQNRKPTLWWNSSALCEISQSKKLYGTYTSWVLFCFLFFKKKKTNFSFLCYSRSK